MPSPYADSVTPEYYEGTKVFVNRWKIKDQKTLSLTEANSSTIRSYELLQANVHIIFDETYDFLFLKYIHFYLFQDAYDWAGKPRAYDVMKGEDEFTKASDMPIYEEEVFAPSKSLYVDSVNIGVGLDRNELVDRCTKSIALINKFHPFPEGNGRTQRVFISMLASRFNMNVDWTLMTKSLVPAMFHYSHIGDDEFLRYHMSKIIVPNG